jgi:hypothetical protein
MTASSGIATGATESRTQRPVFLHTGWRTAGTWLWARFRALPWVEAYHEPLHEILDTLTAGTILRHRADTWTSGHPALTHPYYHEYGPLLRATGGVEGFNASFVTEDFFADPDAKSPALHAYLTRLLDHATARGRQPVLKFCRSLGRVGWMRQVFPHAVHVAMLRNPASQFASAQHYLAHEDTPYFLVVPLAVLLRNRGNDRVADALRIFDVRPPSLPVDATWDDTLQACATWIGRTPVEQWYRGFMAFWLLCVTSLPDSLDRCIDSDLLTLDPGYRTTVRSDLVALTGLPIAFDDPMKTMHLHNGIGVAPEVAWHCHQIAAMLLAARYGANWAATPNGAPIAAMLAHADLVATPDAESATGQNVDRRAYLQRLWGRALAANDRLTAVQAAHAWRPITSRQWAQTHLAELGGENGLP